MIDQKTQILSASKNAISHHYDLSNSFYRLWLDSSLTYSAGLWEKSEDLDAAQVEKIDYHIESSRAPNSELVLDIGCGWGSTLKRLTSYHGVKKAVGLTLSSEQKRFIDDLALANTEVILERWENHVPESLYDAIISIGALEHFAKPNFSTEKRIAAYGAFFKKCKEWLKPNSLMSLQSIIYENWDGVENDNFLAETIFPESDFPYLFEIIRGIEGSFEIVSLRNDRKHYLKTLRCWLKNLKNNRDAAVAEVGEKNVQNYEKYLSVCMYAFGTANINLSRIVLKRLS